MKGLDGLQPHFLHPGSLEFEGTGFKRCTALHPRVEHRPVEGAPGRHPADQLNHVGLQQHLDQIKQIDHRTPHAGLHALEAELAQGLLLQSLEVAMNQGMGRSWSLAKPGQSPSTKDRGLQIQPLDRRKGLGRTAGQTIPLLGTLSIRLTHQMDAPDKKQA